METHKLIERYSLIERATEGSYGQIYKAYDKNSKELVAVKKFKGKSKIGLPTSFVREHYIVSTMNGKHIPKVLDVFPCEDPPAMVIEWLTMNLEQLLSSKKKYAIKEFFLEIVLALDHLHSNGILHRDLKPSNIMLGDKVIGCTPDKNLLEISPDYYSLKLIDYGMSREEPWENKPMTNQVGSLFYRAPELLLGQKRYNNKVDIWSLGCVFYFMQTGATLFKGSSEIDQFKKIITILGTDIQKIKNTCLRESLVSMKVECLPQNWSLIEKHINEIEFDFLKKMVVLEPEKRLSCKELLLHPYFSDQ